MKKKVFYVAALACALSFGFTACSDDEGDEQTTTTNPTDETVLDVNATYSDETLTLTYSGSEMPGKSVSFSTTDGKTATLTMEGNFDITSLLSGMLTASNSTKADLLPSMSPGVFPGELETTISNITLTKDGEKYTFEGSDSQNGRTAEYSGEVQNGKLTLNIDNVVMPEDEMQGTWNLNTTQVLSMTWEATSGITIPGMGTGELPTSTLAALVPTLVNSMITEALQSISFENDGNIVANYLKDGAWVDSPLNIAHYYMKDGQMYVQLNVAMLMNVIQTKADAASTLTDIAQFLPYLSEGVPVKYNVEGNNAQVYVDKDLLLPILSFVANNETITNAILSAVPAESQELAQALLPQIVEVINNTSEISVGLNLQK